MRTFALIILSIAAAQAQPFHPEIPKTWDDAAVATSKLLWRSATARPAT
jgi:hypothetical protein